jgi:hypothetical protein
MVVKLHQLVLIMFGVVAVKSNWWTVYLQCSLVQIAVLPPWGLLELFVKVR